MFRDNVYVPYLIHTQITNNKPVTEANAVFPLKKP